VSYGSVFGAPRSSCTTHLPLTRRLLRCLSLKGEVGARAEDLHPVFPGTGRGIIYQSLSGVSGADPRNCTSHLVLTKDAFRCQNLKAMNGTLGAIRTLAACLRRACSVHRPGCVIGTLDWSRTNKGGVRSTTCVHRRGYEW